LTRKGVEPPGRRRSDAPPAKRAQNPPREDPEHFSMLENKTLVASLRAQIGVKDQQIAILKEGIKRLQKVKQKGLINLLESIGQRNTHFPTGKRTHIIPIRVTPYEHEFLKKLAARKALSGWIRSLILKELASPQQDTIFPKESSEEA